jgi:hypothetical protein
MLECFHPLKQAPTNAGVVAISAGGILLRGHSGAREPWMTGAGPFPSQIAFPSVGDFDSPFPDIPVPPLSEEHSGHMDLSEWSLPKTNGHVPHGLP